MSPAAAPGARAISAHGTPEAAWRQWLPTQCFAQATVSGLLGDAERLVVVAPHPDDEILACGGLLAMHAAQFGAGAPVLIVGVTDGEMSHAEVAGFDSDALAARRSAERMEGAHRLGVSRHALVPLRLPDAALAAHADRLVTQLQALLRPTDLVISTWRLDGHPDHDACGRAAALACNAVGCRHVEALVWMWNWASPGDARVPWQAVVRLALSPPAQAAKRHALAAHTSQLSPRSAQIGPVLGADIQAGAARPHEYFLT